MRTLDVALGARSYPIHVGAGLLGDASLFLPHLKQRKVAVVTNTTVAPLYLERLRGVLEAAGVKVIGIVLPDGEEHKNWSTLNLVFDALLEHRCERGTTLIALGGGVVGDMTGFAAATYQRGAPFIQVPTTLLAQVDSSVGGKTAINHPRGKNMIGAFYQPRAVIADMETLRTLPRRELQAGLAEVIKHGAIRDAAFFGWLESNIGALLAGDAGALSHAVVRSCEIKAEVVAIDEREEGPRAQLNFGHTFGHAIETGFGYGTWLHGEAVALGMVMAADLSARLGMIAPADAARITRLIERAGLPVEIRGLPAERFMELMSHDKKAQEGKLRFVLLEAIGAATVRADVSPAMLAETLRLAA